MHIAKRLNPISSGLFRPKWSAGRLEDLGDQGLFYPRKVQGRPDEGDRDFLRRLGWQVTDEPEGDLVTIDAALTPAARDDALSGPLPRRLHTKLTAFAKRPMTPEETLVGTLEDSLTIMNKAWRETYFIDAATGKVVARSGLDTVELVRRGYSYLMQQYPDQRGRILQDYIANIIANRDIHSQTLRSVLEMYTTRPRRRNVDDLPPARSEYAAYLALLESDEEARDHWLTLHFRIYGALFGLPSVDPAKITRPGDMEKALMNQCLIAHRDPASAQAQARTFANRKVDPAQGSRGPWALRALVILSARAGNFDEISGLLMRNWGLSADDIEGWRTRAAEAMIKPEPCGYY